MPSYDLTVRDFKRYSTILPFRFRAKHSRYISSSDMEWCDILVSLRGNNPLSAYLAEKAQNLGKKIILILDDDLIEYNSFDHPYINKLAKESLLRVLNVAEIMITTSRYLGDKYKKNYGVNYALLDTILDPEEIDPPKAPSDRIKIVYAAGSEHCVFFNEIVKPSLSKLSEWYADRISLTFIGTHVDVGNVSFPVEYVKTMPFVEYQKYMRKTRFDIGLAPLSDTELCRSKYYNKYIEYTKHGICGIYSNLLPFNIVVKDGVNGVLSENKTDKWTNAISKLIDNELLRQQCVDKAVHQLEADFSLKTVAGKLKSQISYIDTFKAVSKRVYFMRQMYLFLAFCEARRRFLNKFMNKKLL